MSTPASSGRSLFSSLFAWAVHALTASGTVLAFLAFLAIEQGHYRLSLLWLGAALIIDGIDGPLARGADVQRRIPGINGATLDLVVDYLTYVFAPAILIYRAGLLSPSIAPFAVAAILVSSLYTFARVDMKTSDNYFLGFPALWNVVAFYLFVLQPGHAVSAIVVGLFSILTFVPIHFVHPLRVRSHQPWLIVLTALWGMTSVALLLPDWSPAWVQAWTALSLLGSAGLLSIGALRTVHGPSKIS